MGANHARAGGGAGEGITFEMACAAAPFTLPSHMTMFTGLWPFEHRARIDRPYFGPAPTLAEHLADHGYTTAGLVANTGMCNATYGLGRGFDYYADMLCNHEVSVQAAVFNSSLGRSRCSSAIVPGCRSPPSSPRNCASGQGVDRPCRGLVGPCPEHRNEAGGPGSLRPFFLFMNFMDVHSPYIPPAAAVRQSGPARSLRGGRPSRKWAGAQKRDLDISQPDGDQNASATRRCHPPTDRPLR